MEHELVLQRSPSDNAIIVDRSGYTAEDYELVTQLEGDIFFPAGEAFRFTVMPLLGWMKAFQAEIRVRRMNLFFRVPALRQRAKIDERFEAFHFLARKWEK